MLICVLHSGQAVELDADAFLKEGDSVKFFKNDALLHEFNWGFVVGVTQPAPPSALKQAGIVLPQQGVGTPINLK